MLPTDDFFLTDNGLPALVFGTYEQSSTFDRRRPKPFYFLKPALVLTRAARKAQKEEEAARQFEREEKERLYQRLKEETPDYQITQLKKRVAELEAQAEKPAAHGGK